MEKKKEIPFSEISVSPDLEKSITLASEHGAKATVATNHSEPFVWKLDLSIFDDINKKYDSIILQLNKTSGILKNLGLFTETRITDYISATRKKEEIELFKDNLLFDYLGLCPEDARSTHFAAKEFNAITKELVFTTIPDFDKKYIVFENECFHFNENQANKDSEVWFDGPKLEVYNALVDLNKAIMNLPHANNNQKMIVTMLIRSYGFSPAHELYPTTIFRLMSYFKV